jgi:hypothetical protein
MPAASSVAQQAGLRTARRRPPDPTAVIVGGSAVGVELSTFPSRFETRSPSCSPPSGCSTAKSVRLRIDDTVAGFTQLMNMLAEQQRLCGEPITVAIETSKGLLPVALRAAGVPVVAINPLAVSRYRDRYSPSRSKSDAGDAFVLANILRTDPHSHRPLPVDSELAQSIHVLARTHQEQGTYRRSHRGAPD